MAKIVFLSRTGISEIGHGGIHRSYQILFEINQIVGEKQVVTISVPEWLKDRKQKWWSSFWLENYSKLNYIRKVAFLENPLNLIAHTPFITRYFLPGSFWKDYKSTLHSLSGPLLSIIDDTRFAKLLDIHKEFGIPTLLVNHNIESLDLGYRITKAANG